MQCDGTRWPPRCRCHRTLEVNASAMIDAAGVRLCGTLIVLCERADPVAQRRHVPVSIHIDAVETDAAKAHAVSRMTRRMCRIVDGARYQQMLAGHVS